jgi:UDP-2,3-diacylglucosamine pyrophosphatase LpxH
MEARRHRAIWLSDIHLGSRGCRAEFLLDFLRHNEADHIYLLGDIVDGWRLRRQWYWPRLHNDVVQKLLRKARKGADIIYVAGNHDEFLRDFLGLSFGGIRVEDEAVHTTADGRRILMLHGDRFDGVVRYAKWLAVLGDWAYEFALFVNRHFNAVRRRLGYPYWSLSSYLKHRVKNAVNFISDFERLVAEEAARRDVEVVVCGHIHKAEMRYIDGTLYCNTGDWVESCTAMVEDADGRLRVLHWADGQSVLFDEALLLPPPADATGRLDDSPSPALARESAAN